MSVHAIKEQGRKSSYVFLIVHYLLKKALQIEFKKLQAFAKKRGILLHTPDH
jgi:hypothetical protein